MYFCGFLPGRIKVLLLRRKNDYCGACFGVAFGFLMRPPQQTAAIEKYFSKFVHPSLNTVPPCNCTTAGPSVRGAPKQKSAAIKNGYCCALLLRRRRSICYGRRNESALYGPGSYVKNGQLPKQRTFNYFIRVWTTLKLGCFVCTSFLFKARLVQVIKYC